MVAAAAAAMGIEDVHSMSPGGMGEREMLGGGEKGE